VKKGSERRDKGVNEVKEGRTEMNAGQEMNR
jgi:hypothetical protein